MEHALVELLDAGLNFIQLPAFRLNEGGDGLSCKKRLRPPSTLGECFEALLRVGVEANREGGPLWSGPVPNLSSQCRAK